MKKAKAKGKSTRDLKIYPFCKKIQQRVLGPGETTAGVMYLSMRIHPKIAASSP